MGGQIMIWIILDNKLNLKMENKCIKRYQNLFIKILRIKKQNKILKID